MKNFQCSCCGNRVFFEDRLCVQCGHQLGFDPQSLSMLTVQSVDAMQQTIELQVLASNGIPDAMRKPFRFCRNAIDYANCNFLVPVDAPDALCESCRQTKVIPNLASPGNLQAWTTIENAKRRLFYTLAKLGLEDGVRGHAGVQTPVYEFMEDIAGEPPVMTGHANGVITINTLEADDAERTRRRMSLYEPYRTLAGHLRHEVGHYYWDQFFLADPAALEEFRLLFGDERADYAEALNQHYQAPKPDWQQAHVSSYASAHPWEDWAETWAHYLHLIDLLETAATYQLCFSQGDSAGLESMQCTDPYVFMAQTGNAGQGEEWGDQDITLILNQGMSVSLLLNSLNRSLGQSDAYPFALSTPVLQKLGFIHNMVRRKTRGYQVPDEECVQTQF